MFKKLMLATVAAIAALIATMSIAFAQVDVNKADQAALDGVKGIGPTTSKAILDERKKNGAFKDWADLQKRVKGVGDKNSQKLSDAGLTVNGQSKSGAMKESKPAANAGKDTKPATSGGKDGKPSSGSEMKKESK